MSFECHNMDCNCSKHKYEVMQKCELSFFSYLWECLNCCHNALGLCVKCLLEMHSLFNISYLSQWVCFLCFQLFIILFASKMELFFFCLFFQST
uniref:Uncharacterized protein n=1 Tax=Gallus gallus TaxID=9031 RepID=A0A8V0XML7_CHICK